MSTKIFNTRLQLKYDSFEHWSADSNQFKLLAGEIAVVNVPAKTGEVASEPAILFKVGDGNKTFNELPWASGLAADVYDWAKREKGLASEIIYKPEVKDEAGTVVTDAIYVNTAISSLEAAVKTLEGIFSEEGEDGTVTGISDIIKNYIDTNLNKADSAQTGKYVSAVSQSNGVISVERADLPTYTLTTGNTNGTVKFNGTDVAVKGLGSAAYEAKDAFDAAGTGAAEAAKVLGTDADVAGTATVHGALKSAAAAAQAGTDAADVVDGKLTEYKTSNDAALDAVRTTANAAAKKADVDSAFEAVNGAIEALEGEAATHATKTELTNGLATKADKEAFEAVQTTVNNFFSDEAVVNDTIDTLKEIANYIATDKEGAADITARVGALEGKVDVDKVSTAIATAKGEATKYTDDEIAAEVIARDAAIAAAEGRAATDAKNKADAAQTAAEATAAADATAKANAAEANAKAYADEKVGALHTVATTGKIEDLDQEVEYIIFNCGTATTLVSEPVTE